MHLLVVSHDNDLFTLLIYLLQVCAKSYFFDNNFFMPCCSYALIELAMSGPIEEDVASCQTGCDIQLLL